MQRFVLAQITDPHLGPTPWFGPRYWHGKRLMGLANWLRGRWRQHSADIAYRLVADLEGQQVDHVAVTGDITNLGLPAEHARALRFLEAIGPPDTVCAIPGNHDIYTDIGPEVGVGRWAAYMTTLG